MVPNSFLPKFGKILQNHLAANLILKVTWVRGWGKMARVSAPGGLGKGMLGQVRLGKVLLISNNKYCDNLLIFCQGPLKFSCARNLQDKIELMN